MQWQCWQQRWRGRPWRPRRGHKGVPPSSSSHYTGKRPHPGLCTSLSNSASAGITVSERCNHGRGDSGGWWGLWWRWGRWRRRWGWQRDMSRQGSCRGGEGGMNGRRVNGGGRRRRRRWRWRRRRRRRRRRWRRGLGLGRGGSNKVCSWQLREGTRQAHSGPDHGGYREKGGVEVGWVRPSQWRGNIGGGGVGSRGEGSGGGGSFGGSG